MEQNKSIIGLASDHAGFELKEFVKEYLSQNNYKWIDYGTNSEASCDYPDFAHRLAKGLEKGEVKKGIAICGTGEGISMTLNKHAIVRAALVWSPEIAILTRQHNDANILCMPGRFITKPIACDIIHNFLTTTFEGGRHTKRIEKIPIKE